MQLELRPRGREARLVMVYHRLYFKMATLRDRMIGLLLSKEMKELIVHLLEQLAASTKNEIDDFIVRQISAALEDFGPEDLAQDP